MLGTMYHPLGSPGPCGGLNKAGEIGHGDSHHLLWEDTLMESR